MAYVPISQQLVNTTVNNIHVMRDKEKSSYDSPKERSSMQADDPYASQLAWGKYLHLRDQVPEDWTRKVKRLELRISSLDSEGDKINACYYYDLSDDIVVPNSHNASYYGFNIDLTDDNPMLRTEHKQVVEHYKTMREIDKKWQGIRKQVVDFLEAAKSLNEALTLWPALALYVSDDYIDRVNNSVKRGKSVSKAGELLAKISIDELTAAAVASKLS